MALAVLCVSGSGAFCRQCRPSRPSCMVFANGGLHMNGLPGVVVPQLLHPGQAGLRGRACRCPGNMGTTVTWVAPASTRPAAANGARSVQMAQTTGRCWMVYLDGLLQWARAPEDREMRKPTAEAGSVMDVESKISAPKWAAPGRRRPACASDNTGNEPLARQR